MLLHFKGYDSINWHYLCRSKSDVSDLGKSGKAHLDKPLMKSTFGVFPLWFYITMQKIIKISVVVQMIFNF